MVDVVEAGATDIKLKIDQVINRGEHILRSESAGGIGDGETELFVDLVATNSSEVIAFRIEETAVQ